MSHFRCRNGGHVRQGMGLILKVNCMGLLNGPSTNSTNHITQMGENGPLGEVYPLDFFVGGVDILILVLYRGRNYKTLIQTRGYSLTV